MASGGGAFEVKLDNEVVFSKLREGRFPNEGEVEQKIGEIQG